MKELTDKEIDRLCAEMANAQGAWLRYIEESNKLEQEAQQALDRHARCIHNLSEVRVRIANIRNELRGRRGTGE